MAMVLINDEHLNNIAAAIREKNGTEETYLPVEMADAIRNIQNAEGLSDIDELIMQNTYVDYTNNRVTKIGNYTFNKNSKLIGAHFDNVTSIGVSAFEYCTGLATVDFPNTTIIYSDAFYYCSALTEVVFPKVTEIKEHAFQNCSNLTKIDLPAAQTVDSNAFSGCSKLTAVIFRYGYGVVDTGGSSVGYYPTGAYFYVPSTLVDTYKSDGSWSSYANRIRAIEDYPEICGTEEAE